MREWMAALQAAGELRVIEEPVSTRHQIAAYVRRSSDVDGPGFLFSNVEGHPGIRVAAGLYGSRRRVCHALGVREREVAEAFLAAIEDPLPAVRREGRGACQEVVWEGAEADLHRLPVVTHSERDAAFITAGVQVAVDPDSGVHGLGIHRMQRFGSDRLGLWAPPERRVGRAVLKSWERGKAQPLAIVLGADPYVALAAVARVPHLVEKYGVAGRLAGQPVELVRAITIDTWVPANAEIVIEGLLHPHQYETESPFGEFTGCYGGSARVPVFTVTAITMRQDPIYHDVLTGFPVTEDHLMNWPAIVAGILRDARSVAPEILAVDVRGNYVYEAVVQMRKRLQHEPWNVMAAVLAGTTQAKYCMVVDPDVDIFNPVDLEWAFCTRVQPATDLHVFPTMVGAPLDPSAPVRRQTGKLGIDATIPLDADPEPYRRVTVPGAEAVRW
jgi:2,5-furandicarboxylate decarboxylase 1